MEKEQVPEIMRGHFEECLAHYRNRLNMQIPKGGKGVSKLKMPLAEFCGVEVSAVTTWFYLKPILPRAPMLFKLWCFLDLIGYRVIELERLPVGRRNFLELIGYNVLTETEAVELLDYASTSTLYRLFQGGAGAVEEREQRMWQIWKERRQALEEKKAEMLKKYFISASIPKESEPVAITEPREEIGKVVSTTGQVLAIFSIVDGLLRLFDSGILENVPPEVAVSVKKDVAKIFRLTSHLTDLGAKVMSVKS